MGSIRMTYDEWMTCIKEIGIKQQSKIGRELTSAELEKSFYEEDEKKQNLEEETRRVIKEALKHFSEATGENLHIFYEADVPTEMWLTVKSNTIYGTDDEYYTKEGKVNEL